VCVPFSGSARGTRRARPCDLVVLDAPATGHALDFLDAPERLTAFLEGRALAAFLAPTRGAARAAGVVLAALRRVTGVGLLDELAAQGGEDASGRRDRQSRASA